MSAPISRAAARMAGTVACSSSARVTPSRTADDDVNSDGTLMFTPTPMATQSTIDARHRASISTPAVGAVQIGAAIFVASNEPEWRQQKAGS